MRIAANEGATRIAGCRGSRGAFDVYRKARAGSQFVSKIGHGTEETHVPLAYTRHMLSLIWRDCVVLDEGFVAVLPYFGADRAYCHGGWPVACDVVFP